MGDPKKVGNRKAPEKKEDEIVSGTQSIERAARILREIASYSTNGLRLIDLSKQLDLKRTTIHRILMCLIREGLVMQHPTSLRYMLGYGLFELGLTAASQFKLREICVPSLLRIAAQTACTAYMTIRSQFDAISIASADADPTRPMNLPILGIGAHRPRTRRVLRGAERQQQPAYGNSEIEGFDIKGFDITRYNS